MMAEVEEVDRISNLPDTLLSEILLYLSTKEAVATCILSKRWISVWTKVPVLKLSLRSNDSEASAKGFKAFVDRVLLCNDSPSLRLFYFSCIQSISDFYYHSWIKNIIRRDVVEIHISLWRGTLPAGSFSSQTLMVLKLWGFELPLKNPVHLPNLLTLNFINITFTDEFCFKDVLMRLPRLEKLFISNCKGLQNICICSSSLKRLTIVDKFSKEKNTIVSAPSLEYLYVDDYTSDYKFTNMPSLAEAQLVVRPYRDCCDVRVVNLLTQVSNLTTLKLLLVSCCEFMYRDTVLHQLPLLPSLIHLVLKCRGLFFQCLEFSWRHLVLRILQRAPNVVSIDYTTADIFDNDVQEDQPRVPTTLSRCPIPTLEVVNVHMFDLLTADKRLLEYLLDNAINLKMFRIHLKGVIDANAISWLFKVPRISSGCKIVVSHQ